jgi:hypothetical protein
MEIVGLKQIFKHEIKNNKMHIKENKNIMNTFLNNIKETKTEINHNRELPNIPIIPALFNKLPDTINNIIFYYVGYKSRLSRMMKYPITNIPIYLKTKRIRVISYACRLYCNTIDLHTEEPRRGDLLKLPQWVQKQMGAYLKDKSLRREMSNFEPAGYRSFGFKHQRLAGRMKEQLTKQLQLSETYYNYFDYHYRNEIRMMKESVNDCNDLCDFID